MRRYVIAATLLIAACSSGESTDVEEPTTPATEAPSSTEAPSGDTLMVGAGSASILPTVDGTTDYLADAPGWTSETTDPNDIGVFVPAFDQGAVAVSNGNGDASWVHDDVRATAVALERGDERAIILGLDTYMTFSMDADEIEKIAKAELPTEWQSAPILIAPTHNHHGPDVAFDINPDYYAHLADQAANAVVLAIEDLRPASAVASKIGRAHV